MNYRVEKGFTLAELLVVIAIMAVLIGVAVGSFVGLIGSGKTEAAEYEWDTVQTAVEAYMAMNITDTIIARTTAAVIASSDTDAPFKTYLRRLPTEYKYSWTDKGVTTQSDSSGGGSSSLPTAIAQWHMNEGSGVTTQDTIGSNHGTLMGGTSWTTSGKSGNALVFDGVDDYVIMNPFNGFPDDEITVELWMKSSDTTKNGTPFSYASVAHHNDFLIYNYRSTSIYRGDSNVNSGLSLNDGSWHHIAVTWKSSGGSVKLYEDGQPVYSNVLWSGTTITAGGSLVIAQEQDSIGGGFQVNQAFLGCIDEIVIYDQALSDSEILSRYNSY